MMNKEEAEKRIEELLDCKDSYEFYTDYRRNGIDTAERVEIRTLIEVFDIDYSKLLKNEIDKLEEGEIWSRAWKHILIVLKKELSAQSHGKVKA